MSEKKNLKQVRLPFQILTSSSPSPSVSTPASSETVEKLALSPNTLSRKRKKSADGENLRSNKIVRTNSKENIVKHETIEILDSGSEVDEVKDVDLDKSVVNDSEDSPIELSPPNVTNPSPKLTPKQLARRQELEARRIEKEQQRQKERQERELQRLKEKEEREELKRKEREQKEEARRQEKEEREKKRLAELEKKEEERRLKEEERKRLIEQKEEERKQKEEERKRQNEMREEERKRKEMEKNKEEDRKKRAAEAFSKFFVAPSKKKGEQSQQQEEETSKDSAESSEPTGCVKFMPFQIRGKMRLAPCVRLQIQKTQLDTLDELMSAQNESEELYLKELKSKKRIPKFSTKTGINDQTNADDDDLIIVNDELEGVGEDIEQDDVRLTMKHRAKFLKFSENRRPAFYGTWRKKSKVISARRPFSQDTGYFEYEVDSDEEWEEEDPGESLHGSDSDNEKETVDDEYEVDNDFFVPHGHLSDDELLEDDMDIEDNSPEAQKARLRILQQEFAAEMKRKTGTIKPRSIGCLWMNGDEDQDGGTMHGDLGKKYHCSDVIWRILKAREMICESVEDIMLKIQPQMENDEQEANKEDNSQKTPVQKKIRPKITEDSIKDLIRLIHGNINSRKFLIREFQAYRLKMYHDQPDFQEFSIKSVDEKMLEISDYKSCPEEGPLFSKKCWYVKPEVVTKYFNDEKLPLPNQWTYILEKEKKPKQNSNDDSKKGSREASPEENVDSSLNVAETSGDRVEQNGAKDSKLQSTATPKTATNNSGKKRVPLLMSVPLNKSINEDRKNNLISHFLKSKAKVNTETTEGIQLNNEPEIVSNSKLKDDKSSPPAQSKSTPDNSSKKRVSLLMSVPLKETINEEKKRNLISSYLMDRKRNEMEVKPQPLNDNDVIEIID